MFRQSSDKQHTEFKIMVYHEVITEKEAKEERKSEFISLGSLTQKGINEMKNKTIAFIMTLTALLAGTAGFGGTYLANNLFESPTCVHETATVSETDKSENTKPPASDADSLNLSAELTTSPIPDKKEPPATSDSLSIPEIAALNSDSVVEIYTEFIVNGWRMTQYVSEGAGSGVVISKNGYIVTNNHVIDSANKITVQLNDGTEYEAELIGKDSRTDIAVIKIDASDLKPAVWGDSDGLVVGELAVAIGNPLGKLGGTVTDGIISALSRDIEIDGHMMNLLQTSAAVNPGNSGGGLFNGKGELIGVVNAKSTGSDIEGIGFAIPANLAKSIADELIKNGKVEGNEPPLTTPQTEPNYWNPWEMWEYWY